MSDRGYLYYETAGVPLKTWTRGVPVEDKAMDQLHNLASLPFIHKHVAAMPDVHWGMGATIGSVIATKGAVIPAAVGVDIGCGMMAVQTTLKAEHLPDSLAGVRSAIESVVPVGFKDHGMDVPRSAEKRWRSHFFDAYHEMQREFPAVATKNSPGRQIGTLGGGNHFIEICLDEEDRVWAMLHSGSRGVGNRIGQFFIAEAKREMEKHFIRLPDKDLAYLVEGSVIFDSYVRAVEWAQDYAREPRGDDDGCVGRSAYQTRRVRTRQHGRQLPPQLRGAGKPLRGQRARHAQGRGARPRGRPGHHPRQHGRQELYRPGQGKQGFLSVLRARCGAKDEPGRSEADVLDRRSRERHERG